MLSVALWLLAAAALWLIGNKDVRGLYLGVLLHTLWIGTFVATETWASVPVSLIYASMYIRGIWKWRKT